MDHKAFEKILNRYYPLAETLVGIWSSLREANPDVELKVEIATGMADSAFLERNCFSIDGVSSQFHSVAAKREARQLTQLFAYDARLRLLGTYQWTPDTLGGTPGQALGAGRIDAKATDFAILTHREWFEQWKVPPGLPNPKTVPQGVLAAELEIEIYARTGVPSLWLLGR
jgi:hypothetical protein